MKLFYKPGACSLAPHIVLREIGISFELDKVNFDTGMTDSGLSFNTISNKNYVPALQLDNAEIITEGSRYITIFG